MKAFHLQRFRLTRVGVKALIASSCWLLPSNVEAQHLFASYFDGVSGSNVVNLTTNTAYPNSPSATLTLTRLEVPENRGTNYGVAISGLLVPSITGTYQFFLNADDNAQLFLSTDSNAVNKILIATEPQWNPPRQFLSVTRRNASTPENRSVPISLSAGTSYFIQALMKQGASNDNLAVAWAGPGLAAVTNGSPPINASFLRPLGGPGINPPIITNQPQNAAVCAGQNAVFSVGVAGTPPFSFQWRRSGTNIPGATSSNLLIAIATAANAGSYSVVVSNAVGSNNSSTAVLTVNQPPVISSQPQNISVCAGQSASFAVTATGTGPLSYQWRVYGTNIAGATLSNYTINPVTVAHAGPYSVRVSNACGTVTSSVPVLTVNQPPTVTEQPQNVAVCAGQRATFKVTALNLTAIGPPAGPIAINEVLANTDPPQQDFIELLNVSPQAVSLTGYSLTDDPQQPLKFQIPSGTFVAAGQFIAFDQTQLGFTLNSTGGVIRLFAPSGLQSDAVAYTAPPIATSVGRWPDGSSNLLLASPSAGGPNVPLDTTSLAYRWTRNGTTITGATDRAYTNIAVAIGDGGTYCVVVTGTCGSVTNCATLTVNTNLAATPLASLVRCPGNTAVFSTVASGTGPFNYQWTKDGITIVGATNRGYTNIAVAAGDAGTYCVIVTGACGSLTNCATLTVNTNVAATPLASLVRCPGGTAAFSTVASGTGPFTYQWTKDGTPIPGATNSAYVKTALGLTDAGTYCVIVAGACGSVTRCATLVLGDSTPPQILCPTNIVIASTNEAGVRVNFAPTATDDCSTNVTIFCVPPSNSIFPIGVTTVECTARDGATNEANCHFLVFVEPRGLPSCNPSAKGTNFWLTVPGNFSPDPVNSVNVTICITGDSGTTGRVEVPALGFQVPFTISSALMAHVSLPKEVELGGMIDVVGTNGVHVTASRSIGVVVFHNQAYTRDAFLALPEEALGRNYLVMAYRNVVEAGPGSAGSQFAIVATSDGTQLTITPASPAGNHAVNIPFTVTLHRGETYQLRSTNSGLTDLSGSVIDSDKPVAVFAGHQCAGIGVENPFFCNYVTEPVLPTVAWGTNYFAVPLATRTSETYRCLAMVNGTVVFTNGNPVPAVILDRGHVFEFSSSGPLHVFATRPITVAQFGHSSDADFVTQSDPTMILLPSQERYVTNYTLCTGTNFNSHFVNVAVPGSQNVQLWLDNNPVSLTANPSLGFMHAQIPVTVGRHVLTGTAPFLATVYGYSEYDSYGYVADMALPENRAPRVNCLSNLPPILADSNCLARIPDLRSTAVDNCTSAADLTFAQAPVPGAVVPIGRHFITNTITDSLGNPAVCVTPFLVLDPAPSILCPSNRIAFCQGGQSAPVNYSVSAYNGCGNQSPALCIPPSGSLFPEGTTRVNCTFINLADQQVSCSFTVSVVCVTITVRRSNDTLFINSSIAGTLETALGLQGPWTNLAIVPNPSTSVQVPIRRTDPHRFFRIRN